MSHKRARESTSDKENSITTPTHGKSAMIKKQRLDLDTFRSAGGKTKTKPKVHVIMQEQLRARQVREILTPPPSSELDIQLPEQDEAHLRYAQPRKVQFRPAPSSQNQSHADSMYRLMTTPMETLMSSSPVLPTSPLKEDYALMRSGQAREVSAPVSLVTLAVDYDGSHNLILGRSRKTSLSPSTLHVIEEAGPSNQMVDSKTLPTSFPSDLAFKLPTGSSSTRAISTLPTRLLPLPRKAQHTSRNHVLVTPSPSSLQACLFVHVMGQNGCRVRILGARTAGIPYHHQMQHVGVGKRYTAGRVVTIRSPTTATGGRGLVVDVEIDMYSCKTIVHWAVPTRSEDVSEDDDDETESESEDVLRPWNLELKRLHPDQPQFVRLHPDHEEREDTPEAPSGQNQRVSSGPLMFQPSSGLGLVAPLSPPTSSPRRLPSLDLPGEEEEDEGDVEMSMVSDKGSDNGQRDDDADEDGKMGREEILNDLPPSSPPMDLESLPAFPEDEDEEEAQVEVQSDAQSVVSRPTSPVEPIGASVLPVKARDFAIPSLAPSALGLDSKPATSFASTSTLIRRPVPAQPTGSSSSSSSSSGFFGFDLGAPSRKNVVVRKVMISRPASASSIRSRESTPVLKVKEKEKDAEEEKKIKKATDEVKTVKSIMVTAPTPASEPVAIEVEKTPTQVTIEEASSIPETPLNTTSTLPEPSTPLTPLPLSPELANTTPPIPVIPTTTIETTTAKITTTVEPPSSPARSIYSQMTSDSESEGEAEPGQKETVGVVRRLGEMQKKKTQAKSLSHVKGLGGKSKAVKRELIEAGEAEEVKEVKKRKVDVSTALTSSDTADTATSETAAPAPAVTTETTTAPLPTELHSDSTPHPPKDLDLKALVATSVVFSGVSAISAFDLVKTILDSQPSMRRLGSDSTWATWIGDVLRGEGMFGRVDRKGKDSSGHPLLPLYYYLPANDPDQTRAAELGACMRPLRGVQRGGGKAIDWRPVGSRGRR
ncbi:hypothetical protein FFLO_02118 [Filobasidium floriforme]|uniref:Uncharacterized protein n=1 Tax=Filobasidium floriforme TaxID=5210 RepID=A0A8K0NS26_9TREE|nr:hypothetical protein FFLO_02118 [Filobasidium floriforme]